MGAGAVHLAIAPAHFNESTAEGVGFLVAAWLQVGCGVAVVLRPSRGVLSAVIAVSAACIAAWALSRTAGLPFGEHSGHAESMTIIDGTTVVMESTAILIAVALLSRATLRFRSPGLAVAAIIGVFTLTSALIATPEARDHATVAHGDHADVAHDDAEVAHDHHAEVAPSDRTAQAQRSQAVSTDADSHGGTHDHATPAPVASSSALTDLNGHEIEGVKAQDVAHEMEPDEPLDAATRSELARQLVAAREAALQYPTVADAEKAGYHLVGGGFGPGAGAHYIGFGGGGGFDPAKPPTLIYSGIDPTSQVVGLMYLGSGDNGGEPEGFAGPNDHWHRHSGVCMKGIEVIFPVDASVTEAQCTAADGNYMDITTWMVHAWVVPGWDSPSGVFSHENPNLRCADGTFDTDEIGRCQGT
ncbi:MAG: hypothetical protein OEW85_06730 [Acidimicrobiia bacterium]|nr:hypothetical protein [Acidimicrobiia bacterium]